MPTTATWTYQGRVITSINDMPEDTYGFIYEVDLQTHRCKIYW